MGRWGHRLFEGDMDIDLACDLVQSLGVNTKKWEYRPAQTVNQTDMLAPADALVHYQTKEYAKKLADVIVPSFRASFDKKNLGERLMAKCRSKEGKIDWDNLTCGEYKTIILGALLMRVGAKIKDNYLRHLLDLVPQVVCIPGTTWALEDTGFRSRGQAQFVAALNAYEPGEPRDFQELSCFNCVKIESEIGHKPLLCNKCKRGYDCDKECQKNHWQAHKSGCILPGQRRMLNV